MRTRRSFVLSAGAGFVALLFAALSASAEESSGVVKSVNADGKTFVLRVNDKDMEVKVDSATLVEKAKKGKIVKKFTVDRLSPGGTLSVTHEKGVASKIQLEKKALKKKKGK
jgi:hypothetical protein